MIVGGMSGGAIALSIALMHGTRITVQSDDIIERINASPMMVAGGDMLRLLFASDIIQSLIYIYIYIRLQFGPALSHLTQHIAQWRASRVPFMQEVCICIVFITIGRICS